MCSFAKEWFWSFYREKECVSSKGQWAHVVMMVKWWAFGIDKERRLEDSRGRWRHFVKLWGNLNWVEVEQSWSRSVRSCVSRVHIRFLVWLNESARFDGQIRLTDNSKMIKDYLRKKFSNNVNSDVARRLYRRIREYS